MEAVLGDIVATVRAAPVAALTAAMSAKVVFDILTSRGGSVQLFKIWKDGVKVTEM